MKIYLFLTILMYFNSYQDNRDIESLLERFFDSCTNIEDIAKHRALLERLKIIDKIPISAPVRDFKTISSGYGLRIHPISKQKKFHTGIDISQPLGTPVFATANGKVEYASIKGGYGRCIIISHEYGYSTYYAHLSAYYCKVGDYVSRGTLIGFVGATGKSTGYHLHYEIRKNGKHIKPYWYGYKRRN